ncbi:FADH(2)-oxidizing methylenetetrahydrofolate--tRNA-(uracil(54)-C(5))-methyltransferase TrmFO [Megamonas funiformis]|uniref:FADH(2)-oxidizing methylenetetrahydrofolate--tRNA-(uracil(54)-C(5))- methyltransferase TrmFO n=1 Tax=Megamonas funiformis TaxID=437897 RepID=UPI001CD72DA2|nr:FADH(2)-oxidizing methylenetetrahydrofolate--tRNA-(uracil(54)-C(5))-methyltransferase TrmFO [Megamonas funiformis]UBS49442.1 FADH(2)-oxidizing methylenetetrahydrofolate--tRNA-(uracil(54)-C(5))-methyltransferase TrmFO [Megamonas funiformis]GLU97394.1 methylenetetrahydrofolate--tRNA-(uracil-5-)-methyltransferase TrmFO [Megamonas funiformis]
MKKVIIVGAGMAGSEAAWQVAQRGIKVDLYEMRPKKSTPAHKTEKFAELVCSNSLRGAGLENAVGLLKEEMRQLNSIIMESADINRVPAGGALAVDREGFSQYITDKVKNHPNVTVINKEIETIPREDDAITIIASGPLTSEVLAKSIGELTGQDYFYFYDAAAPLISKESIDMSKAYRASRYGKGTADYINCPMDKEEYEKFWQELTTAELAPIKEFEKAKFFEGCMPVEEMARRGIDTLLYGPLKPVGLEDPKTGKRPYAVVQLRQDNAADSLYNIVGFQTHLKWPEQKRVFGLIPGLENAEFVRYGVMHRNTFINSPELLRPTLQYKDRDDLLFAGQMTGVEGYIESAASGLVAGVNAAYLAKGENPVIFPEQTAHGSMCKYITSAVAKHFQPMNANFGLMPPLEERIRDKKLKKQKIAERALEFLAKFKIDVLKLSK